MTLHQLQKFLVQSLDQNAIGAADQEARIILQTRLGLSWADMIARPDQQVCESDLITIKADLEKRLSGITLGRIYGHTNFYGLDFYLSPHTLEPRNDTEILIDIALQKFPDPPAAILDLGTGTGCILITLLYHWQKARGVGVDISPQAIQTARDNATHHCLAERAGFVQGSWAEEIDQMYDLVVSNPPYIQSSVIPALEAEVRNHDPILALDGGKDGLEAYKIIFSQLPQILNPGGSALLEIGYDQARKVERLSKNAGLTVKHVHPDRAGRPRVLEVALEA